MSATLLKDFEMLKEMNLIVRTFEIIAKGTENINHYIEDIYSDNEKSKLIKYDSKYTDGHNALHVFTGELHGGYIGININCKENKKSYVAFCIATINKLPRTLTCTTPNAGFHYLFKLNDTQKNALSDYKVSRAKLFDHDIDVLYNTGRCIMSGQYGNDTGIDSICPLSFYNIIDSSKPAILPDIIFNEIIRKRNLKILSKEKLPITNKAQNKQNHDGNENIDNMLKSYLDCLKPSRCDIRESWLRIGAVIFNEHGSFKLFNKWSKSSKKYEKDACKKLWDSYNPKHINKLVLCTLKRYAKEDNPYMYHQVIRKNKFKKPLDINIKKSKKILYLIYDDGGYINDKNLADLVHCLYPGKFIYDEKNKFWYSLNKYNIYEREDKSLFSVRELINTHICDIVTEYSENRKIKCEEKINKIITNIKTCKNKEEKGKLRKMVEHLEIKLLIVHKITHRLIQFLCTEKKKDSIIRALATLCRKKNIYGKLDTINPYLFAFKNGVYDLENKMFRLADPDEYVNCTCKYKYRHAKQKYIDILEKIFSDIFPDDDERQYVLKILSTVLIGTNLFEIFIFFIGMGSNGKGLVVQLLDCLLGGYFGTLDIDYFNSKDSIKSGAANSSLAACKNSRWVNISELESYIKLKDNRLKQLSGRDKIQARNLYGNAFEYIAKFKLCFQTNEKPILDGADDAIKRRLRYITFRTKFVDNPTKPNERQIDRELKDRILLNDKYKNAFFTILLKYYYMLIDDNMKLVVPKTFQDDVDSYLAENDPISSFVKDCLEKTNNNNDTIQSSDLYNEFKIYSNDKYIHTSKFKANLEKHNIISVRERTGTIYHKLIFKHRPSANTGNDDDNNIEFIK